MAVATSRAIDAVAATTTADASASAGALVRAWFARRATAETDLTIWLGLLVAALLLLGTGTPPTTVVASCLLVSGTLLLTLRWRLGALAIAMLLFVGLWLRSTAAVTGFSDVLGVTSAAVRLMTSGGDPYGIGYQESFPPGAPFAYGPFALLWYLPAVANPRSLELLVSLVTLGVLAARGRPLGLAIYAVLPALLVTATDGSNDTSAGLILLLALLAAERQPVAGAVLLGVAAAFKPYALAWLLPLLAYGGVVWPLVAFVVASLAIWGPALLLWGPSAILWSFRTADEIHAQAYYSLAWVTGGGSVMSAGSWQLLRLLAGGVVAIATLPLVRTARSFVVVGAGVYAITLFTGWWSTFAYLAAIAPIVCWHLDDWLGLGDRRVVWPGDPVGTVSAWVDERWPILRPWSMPRAVRPRTSHPD
jgi:hypothetical protein